MTEKETDNPGTESEQSPAKNLPPTEKKKSRPLLILFLAFTCIVTIIFITQQDESVNWVEDYELGIKMAKEQNKPVLLTFYKLHTRFCSLMSQNTYNNPDVIKYIEENFIPIFIDVSKQPKIAEKYKVTYYPTHYIKAPDSDELIGPHVGYDVPVQFIQILEGHLKEIKSTAK